MNRNLPSWAAAFTAIACGLASPGLCAEPVRVRDRFWIFTCVAGADNPSLKRPSRMTPAEGALYLGVPNLIMVCWQGKPAPPYDQYAIPFRPLKQVVWSVVGSGGKTADRERAAVFELAARTPSITGVFMDDFFTSKGDRLARLSLDEVRAVRRQAVLADRRLDLWVVLYTHQLHRPVQDYLRLCDKVTLWTWRPEDLAHLEANMAKFEKLAGSSGKLLGLYMYDFGGKREMPVDRMKRQCELGLEWLKQGRIEGMIFLANTVADLDFEAVEWTRRWIADVGDRPLPTSPR